MKRSLQQGFTLIELMIVVAVIAILAAVALPMYQDYAIRAKVSEVILAASACRTSITETVQSTGKTTLPDANAWGCEANPTGANTAGSTPTKYVFSITTANDGKITVKTNPESGTNAVPDLKDAASKAITLVPFKNATTALGNSDVGSQIFKWTCGPAATNPMPTKYLPGSCRDAVTGAGST